MENIKKHFWVYLVIAFLAFCFSVWAIVDDVGSDSDPFYQFNAMSDEDKLDWFEFTVLELRETLQDINVKQSQIDSCSSVIVRVSSGRDRYYMKCRVWKKQVVGLTSVYNDLAAKFNHRKQFVTWQNLTDEMNDRWNKLPVRYKPI